MAISQSIAIFSPYLFGRGVDAVINHNANIAIFFIIFAFVVALIQTELLEWFKSRIELKYMDSNVVQLLSARSMKKMFEFSIGQHLNEHSGVKQSIVKKGQGSLETIMYTVVYNIMPNAVQVFVTTIILLIFDWKIGGLAIIFVTAYVLISLNRNKKYFPGVEAIRKKWQDQGKLESELYRNSALVIGEAKEEKSIDQFKALANETIELTTKTWLKFLNIFYKQNLIIIVGQYLCLSAGIYLIFNGHHTPGMFVTMFAWIASIFGKLETIMNTQRYLLSQIADIKKFYDLLDILPDIDPNTNSKTPESIIGDIEFKNVSFSYPYRESTEEAEKDDNFEEDKKDSDNAVSNISFKIPAGAKIGFVGKSGSGKSTIVNLIRRYYDPTDGEILIDDTNLKEINLRWLRGHIGNVEQKIDLFDRSIRDNILFGVPTDKKVEKKDLDKAVKDASLTEFITKLKDHGLDTMIGENGIKVSGGERQRIGIARALIKNPKIMIFDEATSALDAHNEKLIHNAINKGSKGRTTIIVAHRLSTIADADKIFVVSEGHIVGEGTHIELAKSCPQYKELIKHQVF